MQGWAPQLGTIARTQESERHVNLPHSRLERLQTNPIVEFRKWAVEHGKEYLDDEAEFLQRFRIWRENLEYVHEYNTRGHTHWVRTLPLRPGAAAPPSRSTPAIVSTRMV